MEFKWTLTKIKESAKHHMKLNKMSHEDKFKVSNEVKKNIKRIQPLNKFYTQVNKIDINKWSKTRINKI